MVAIPYQYPAVYRSGLQCVVFFPHLVKDIAGVEELVTVTLRERAPDLLEILKSQLATKNDF